MRLLYSEYLSLTIHFIRCLYSPSIVSPAVTLSHEPFLRLMTFSSLLHSSVVAVMISMIGGGFLAANRRSRSPPSKSTLTFPAVEVLATGSSEASSDPDGAGSVLRLKTEESGESCFPVIVDN